MAQTILYYPTIDIKDSAWLRNALLYWDSISSIVPYDDYSDFSPELRYLQRCGIYKPVFPRDLFCSEYASDFTHAIVTKLDRYKRRSNQQYTRRNFIAIHRNKVYAPALHELIHYRKVEPALLEYFADRNFINDYNCEGWMEIDAGVASIYMQTLAEFVVKCCSEDAVIGTDLCKYQSQIYTPTKPRGNTACISLALNNCLPQPTMNIGFEELLDFKNEHKDELAEFRKKLREFEKTLSTCVTVEEVKAETEKFKEDWGAALMKEKNMFSFKKNAFSLGTLSTLIAVPAIAEPLGRVVQELYPGANNYAVLGGVAAVSLAGKFVSYRNKVNEQRSSSGFSYIMKASRLGIIDSV